MGVYPLNISKTYRKLLKSDIDGYIHSYLYKNLEINVTPKMLIKYQYVDVKYPCYKISLHELEFNNESLIEE